MTDQELRQLLAQLAVESDKRQAQWQAQWQAEADKRQAEAERRQAEADKRQAEAERQRAELNQTLSRISAEADRRQAELDQTLSRISAEADKRQAEADRRLAKLGDMLGGISNSQGEVAEEFFFNSLLSQPVLGDITFNDVTAHANIGTRAKPQELDLVLVNGQAVAVIEVKYKVRVDDIAQLEKQLALYRKRVPKHRHFSLYGGIAGFSIPAKAVALAHQKGLFVLKRKGDTFIADTSAMRSQTPPL